MLIRKAIHKATAAPSRAAKINVARQATLGVNSTSRATQPFVLDPAQVYRSDPATRIAVIRQGLPASQIANLSTRMGISKKSLVSSLGLSSAVIRRKERNETVLSNNETERVLGVETLIGMTQAMVEQSGNANNFIAARWVSNWLSTPLPALAGATPASYMDTFEGQKLVAELLSMSQSGAYA